MVIAEINVFYSDLVMPRIFHEGGLVKFIVQSSVVKDANSTKSHVVKLVNDCLIKSLSSKHRHKSKPELHADVEHVLIETPANKFAVASVALSPVN